jgi:hypothetical protein
MGKLESDIGYNLRDRQLFVMARDDNGNAQHVGVSGQLILDDIWVFVAQYKAYRSGSTDSEGRARREDYEGEI